jgi:hypothetical protein
VGRSGIAPPPPATPATAENLLAMVRRLPEETVWQVIAIGRANLELTAMNVTRATAALHKKERIRYYARCSSGLQALAW